ncbi:AAA family ATPase [Salinigranum halophilum]|uniref:AAA family ATPase n=1 Tax=Salinigranum halophilum TaxID=2565931 RepID=UPI0010A8EAF4|nr:AAA family ATPase [Salinigranum halophilum]
MQETSSTDGTCMGTYIRELRVTNWRQYKGTQTINLEPNGKHRINAIIGHNGTGKTNLAKAVSVCLNGAVPGEVDTDEGEPQVNSEVMDDLSVDDTAEGSIELRLTHLGTDYIIQRRFTSTKRPDGCENDIESKLTLERYTDSGWETVERPNRMLTRILPPEVQQYYFFDGERLERLFKPGYESKVRDAVRELSQVEVLEEGHEHVETLRTERRRAAQRNSGNVTEAQKTHKQREVERKDIIHDLAKTVRQLETKQQYLDEVETQMGAASDPDVLELIRKRATLEAEIEQLQDDEKELEAERDRLLLEAGTVNFAMDALDEATTLLDRLGAKGQLPPDIRRSYIADLLDDGVCICGCDLDKHPTRRATVEALRDETPDISAHTIEVSYELPRAKNTGHESFDDLRTVRKKLKMTTKRRFTKEEDRDELSERLRSKNIPSGVDLESLDQDREQLRAEVNSLRTERGRLTERLNQKEEQVKAATERVEKELAKDSRCAEQMREVDLYRRAEEALREMKQDLMAQVRREIADGLNTYFNELTWKDETYTLGLGSDFSINIEGPEGVRQVERLSAGEKELLALSFIAALTDVSGFDAPILIDTPVGRIDQEHRATIASKLPGYLDGHQLTFLFTDSEYDDVVHAGLESRLANKYRLENDNRTTTAVSEIPDR